jgi:uncharacterized protein YjbI with pentapeptide repeats
VVGLVRAALFATNVLLPLSVLCLAQYEFLRYHSIPITLWHQILVTTDLVVTWYFLVVLPARGLERRWVPRTMRTLAVLASLGVLFFSFFMAIVPGSYVEAWLDEPFPPADWLARNLDLAGELLISEAPPPELLAVAEAQSTSSEESYVRHAVGARLQGRDLRGANFDGAKLFNADLRGADLRGVSLEGADLRGANLMPLDVKPSLLVQERSLRKSESLSQYVEKPVKRTSLDRAKLRGAKLDRTKLILASLVGADLREVDMSGFELTGADFAGAFLQGAKLARAELSYADLSGANLSSANLAGATLDHSSLTGATLFRADAMAASFAGAHLEGAQLAEAKLWAADFRGATLTGSDLRRAHLQGATSLRLEALDLRGAHLGGLCGPSPVRKVDLRFVEFSFLPDAVWAGLRHQFAKSKDISRGERDAVLGRIDAARARKPTVEAQAACLGTPLTVRAPVKYRKLLYFDEQRIGVLASWPPMATQRQGRWDEAEFHRSLATDLLKWACSNRALAEALALRAAGEAGPGDLDFESELAQQMAPKLQADEGCPEFHGLDERLKKKIYWRLRKLGRDARN